MPPVMLPDRAQEPRTTPVEALARIEAAIWAEELPVPDAEQEAVEAAAKADEPPPAVIAAMPAPPGIVEGIPQLAPLAVSATLATGGLTGMLTNATTCYQDGLWYQWARPCPAHKDPYWLQWATTNCAVTGFVGTASSMTDGIWVNWSTTTGGPPAPRIDPAAAAAARREQQQAHEARALQRAADQVVRDKYRAQAGRRARRLLTRYLTEEQRRQLSRHHYFDVLAPSGRLYRIMPGIHGNVREMVALPDGTLHAVASLCCQPPGVPDADAHLTQLLWLRTDEQAFRRIANIRRYDPNRQLVAGREADLQGGRAAP